MSDNIEDKACAILLGVAIMVIFFPFVGIWVINTLFDLNNPYDFTHWFAVLISGIVLWGSS